MCANTSTWSGSIKSYKAMIKGHGDDAYKYNNIVSDFSSNICKNPAACEAVMGLLSRQPELLAHYPEPEAWTLEKMIAEKSGVPAASVIVTNGATDAIYLVAQTFRVKHIIEEPTFSEYQDACQMFPSENNDLTCLWICNPNNPTGTIGRTRYLADITKDYSFVVIDQSYEQYAKFKCIIPTTAWKKGNVIQIHSMTKTYGVPGLRLGYIITSYRLAEQLRKQMRPWSVSALAIEAGKFLLQHDELKCTPDLEEGVRLRIKLNKIPNIKASSSNTNFFLVKVQRGTAAKLKKYLAKEHHMLIRDASNFRGLTPQHFRIAAQTPAENDALVEAIREYLNLPRIWDL